MESVDAAGHDWTPSKALNANRSLAVWQATQAIEEWARGIRGASCFAFVLRVQV